MSFMKLSLFICTLVGIVAFQARGEDEPTAAGTYSQSKSRVTAAERIAWAGPSTACNWDYHRRTEPTQPVKRYSTARACTCRSTCETLASHPCDYSPPFTHAFWEKVDLTLFLSQD